MAELIRGESIAEAWEKSVSLFQDDRNLLRFNSQRGPCIEVQDVLFDIGLSAPVGDLSPLYPVEFHSLVDGYVSGFLNESSGRRSTVAARLYRWECGPESDGSIDQFGNSVRLLQNHPNTRYNVLTFWDPAIDAKVDNPVSPLVAQMQARHGMLSGTLFARTVDAWHGGFPMLVGFARLIRRMAQEAGMRPSGMRVLAGSYHVYEMDLPILQSIRTIR